MTVKLRRPPTGWSMARMLGVDDRVPELEETPLARQLAPIFAIHDKRSSMYYPSMHRLSLRKEMQRW